jgi:hypothetical protein
MIALFISLKSALFDIVPTKLALIKQHKITVHLLNYRLRLTSLFAEIVAIM